MGFFSSSSSSSSESKSYISDEKITLTDDARNASVRGSGASAADNGVSNAVILSKKARIGGNLNIINESLDADLAARVVELNSELSENSIVEVGKRLSDALTNSLSFADNVLEEIVNVNAKSQEEAYEALSETKEFAGQIIAQAQETNDDRLSKFSTVAFFGMAILAGLLVWRG